MQFKEDLIMPRRETQTFFGLEAEIRFCLLFAFGIVTNLRMY